MNTGFDVNKAAEAVTGRRQSLFSEALAQMHAELISMFSGARILVTGGAGFIAGQTIRTILPLEALRIVVADTNENSLAELVRDLRTSAAIPARTELAPRLVDVTSPLLRRMVAIDGPFDIVLAFAAAKHVRSERDPVSALHMLHVNVNGTTNAVDAVVEQNPGAKVFVVSTDKAADPASLMGASKRVMELAVLAQHPGATLARFANVAFSAGSLLESWLIRMGHGQILPVPADTERYFVTPRESGQLCALAATAPAGAIVIPDQDAISPIGLQDALARLLAAQGLEPHYYRDSEPHRPRLPRGRYPVLVTRRDTPGEKRVEVFCGADESVERWITNLDLLLAPEDTCGSARSFGRWVSACIANPLLAPSLDEMGDRVANVLPNMNHVAGQGGLDERI